VPREWFAREGERLFARRVRRAFAQQQLPLAPVIITNRARRVSRDRTSAGGYTINGF
jgi:hypothetical protein